MAIKLPPGTGSPVVTTTPVWQRRSITSGTSATRRQPPIPGQRTTPQYGYGANPVQTVEGQRGLAGIAAPFKRVLQDILRGEPESALLGELVTPSVSVSRAADAARSIPRTAADIARQVAANPVVEAIVEGAADVGKAVVTAPEKLGERIVDAATDAAKAIVGGVSPAVEGGDAGPSSVVTASGQQWYPQGTGDWSGEPGGMYLSARYARQFGTWGMTYAGEGWRAVADRQGWDARLHPGFTQASLRYQDRPYVPRSGGRLYYEEL